MTYVKVPVEPDSESIKRGGDILSDKLWGMLNAGSSYQDVAREVYKAMCLPSQGDPAEHWLILFDDTDRKPEIYTDESAARRRYEQISVSWNAHLFAKVNSNSRDAEQRATDVVLDIPDFLRNKENLAADKSAALLTDAEIDAAFTRFVGHGHSEAQLFLRRVFYQAKLANQFSAEPVACRHEWYQGACVHCNRPAPTTESYARNGGK